MFRLNVVAALLRSCWAGRRHVPDALSIVRSVTPSKRPLLPSWPCRPAPSSLNLDVAAAPDEQQAAAAVPSGTPPQPASLGRVAAAAVAAGTPPRSGGATGSPGLGALDPDLAYLHISDDQERQEKEYLQQVGVHWHARF